MKIRVLGSHNTESKKTRMPGLLIDGVIAFDGAALTSTLSLKAQLVLKAVFISHRHYDHLRDIPALGMNLFLAGRSLSIYSHDDVFNSLKEHLLNGDLYPRYYEKPPQNPTFRFIPLNPFQTYEIEGYSILPVPVNHAVPALGYQITSKDGGSLFYTGDTGINLAGVWEHVSPQLLVIELTASDRYTESVGPAKHLTPHLLKQELIEFKKLKGYLPQVLTLHMNPMLESEIAAEITQVAQSLNASITLAKEGMKIEI